MWLKEMLKQDFWDPKKIIYERYKSAKFVFIISSFLFFVNFYLVWAKFYLNIFNTTLWVAYIMLILSFMFYIYYSLKNLFIEKIKAQYFLILIVILVLLFMILTMPLVVQWGLMWLVEIL